MILPTDTTALRRLALAAARLWDAREESVTHIADSGNSVYQIDGPDGPRILRLTSPSYRTRAENEAEAEFLLHLGAHAAVSTPVPSSSGALVEEVSMGGLTMLASAFGFAPGVRVDYGSELWGEDLIREWGRSLGRIHAASRSFTPSGPARRWHWRDEGFIANAPALIPADDRASHRELEEVLAHLEGLPVTPETFGIIHADFAPQNFHYHPESGITAFDFGNCCYHWYASDIAISLSTFRRHPAPERERYRRWLLEGYMEENAIDEAILAELNWLIRLRILYVYLSRLTKFGPEPGEEERKILATMRQSVHEKFIW
jgi:amicoumacin kinase